MWLQMWRCTHGAAMDNYTQVAIHSLIQSSRYIAALARFTPPLPPCSLDYQFKVIIVNFIYTQMNLSI